MLSGGARVGCRAKQGHKGSKTKGLVHTTIKRSTPIYESTPMTSPVKFIL